MKTIFKSILKKRLSVFLIILVGISIYFSSINIPNIVHDTNHIEEKQDHKEQPLVTPVLVKPTVVYKSIIEYILLEGVKYFEGYYSESYRCSAYKKTIGYGHTGKGLSLRHINKQKAEELLDEDLDEARDIVLQIVKVPLTEGQLACLVSFTFNCGDNSLRKLVNGKNRLNSGNYKSVEKILPMYCKAGGKVLKGLEKRRSWELQLWKEKDQYFVER
jgi:lysozyme